MAVQVSVSWIELSLGEVITFAEAVGTASSFGAACGISYPTSRIRLVYVAAAARPAYEAAEIRLDQVPARSRASCLTASTGVSTLAEGEAEGAGQSIAAAAGFAGAGSGAG